MEGACESHVNVLFEGSALGAEQAYVWGKAVIDERHELVFQNLILEAEGEKGCAECPLVRMNANSTSILYALLDHTTEKRWNC